MHALIEISEISQVLKGDPTLSGHAYRTDGIYFESEIAKFEGFSLAELYGYLIADHFGVRAPRFQGFIHHSGHSIDYFPNRIGLLIEDLGDEQTVKKLTWKEAAQREPYTTAKALVVAALGASDDFEIILPPSGDIFFVDLDLQVPFPIICETMPGRDLQDLLERPSIFNGCLHDYFYNEARKHGLDELFLESAISMLSKPPPDLSICGHPDAQIINRIASYRMAGLLHCLKDWLSHFSAPVS